MLKIYQNIFKKLEEMKIPYLIYKGLSHINEDLDGDRGDIDILIDDTSKNDFTQVLSNNGFKKVFGKNFPFYYFGLDHETDKFVMVDMDTKVRLGEKPYTPYFFSMRMDKLKKEFRGDVWVLHAQDYIPLMFFQRVTASVTKEDSLIELQKLLADNHDIEHSYIFSIVENFIRTPWDVIERDILNAQDWQDLQKKYKKNILENIQIDYILLYKQKFQRLLSLGERIKNKVLESPPYKMRNKGKLITFIGVDGAGKSSIVEYILNLDYFKYTGIKRVYFGNNEYWIPGVTWGLNNVENKWLKIFFALLAHSDKSLRSVKAYYYMQRGYIVVADRFYYDDFIGEEMRKETIKPTKSILKRMYRKIFEPRVWIKPDLTIFLDVSPDVAYRRKQDFSYEKMLEVNKAYKAYMPNVQNIIIIDADDHQKSIYKKVISLILRLDE